MQLVKKTSLVLTIVILLSIILLGTSYDIGYAEGSDTPESTEEPSDPTPEPAPDPTPALSSNADLSWIFIKGADISVGDKTTLYYTFDNPVGSYNVWAQAEDSKASISGTGDFKFTKGGETANIYITVTAEDGITQKQYTLSVTNPEGQVVEEEPLAGDEIPEEPTISGPFTINIEHSSTWCNPCYEYKSKGIRISDTVGVSAKIYNISSDYTINATINGEPFSNTMDKSYSVYYKNASAMIDINCRYSKEVNFGDDINKSASFPSVNIKITITDNQTGQTETITHNSKANTFPSAYNAYFNHRYDDNFYLENSFINYIQDKRIDKNVENIAENNKQITENAMIIEENLNTIIAIQTDIGELNCRVNELESDVENLRQMNFTFCDEFSNNPNLETIDFWYRENPSEVAFRLSDLLFTTAHAADEDWIHIVLDSNNYEIELEFDKNKQYDVYWVANYSDETSSQEYYQIVPNSKELIVEADSNMQTPIVEQEPSVDAEPKNAKDTARQDEEAQLSGSDILEDTDNRQGITTTTLIIVIAVALVLGGGIGMLGFMFGSKKKNSAK